MVGAGAAYLLWFRGLERLPVSQLSFLALISPLVATAIGWTVLDQSLTGGQLAGAVLIAGTVAVTQRRSPDRPNPIGVHEVTSLAIDATAITVEGLEAVDGTPVLDLKPALGPVPAR